MSNVPIHAHNSITNSENLIEGEYVAQRPYQTEDKTEHLRYYLRILVTRKWTIILSVLITLLVIIWNISQEEPRYEATSTLMIEEIGSNIERRRERARAIV